jgi:nucleotide-binding universal stress UspA family protein
MHILVATDGTLDPAQAADAVARWHSDGDEVVVFTTINIPADVLDHLGDPGVKEAAHIALEAGQGIGDRAAEQLIAPDSGRTRAPVDSPVLRSLAATAHSRTNPVAAALAERGIEAEEKWTTNNNRTARSILNAITLYDSEALIIGSHGRGRFEGKLGATGTKLIRQAAITVIVLRTPAATES